MDMSICHFVPLDLFIPKWVEADKEYGFWASNISTLYGGLTNINGIALPQNVLTCHDSSNVSGNGNNVRTASSYFLVSSRPHNPLVDEWLAVYRDYLLTSPDPRQPYFLSHSILTQARMKNATVDTI